jgi:hypothetical protein
VAARRHAEHAPVLPAELRRAAVADRVPGSRDVTGIGQQPGPGLVQPDLLLELDGRQRGQRAEVKVKGRDAHRRERGQIRHPQRLVVMAADPADRPRQLGQAAVGETDLPQGIPLGAGEQPPQDLPLDAVREHRGGAGLVEQAEEAGKRVEQGRGGIADRDPGWHRGRPAARDHG